MQWRQTPTSVPLGRSAAARLVSQTAVRDVWWIPGSLFTRVEFTTSLSSHVTNNLSDTSVGSKLW